jgi:hypothetical protein
MEKLIFACIAAGFLVCFVMLAYGIVKDDHWCSTLALVGFLVMVLATLAVYQTRNIKEACPCPTPVKYQKPRLMV